ncbi:hypothetical protein LSG31_21325 [Fodinisporobacter ferrooxydans]|uniref:Citrate transporter-like domain-containing protein n=1 Tax=Fodinisporobacter ferrooxydans TaxID=2901836 RepID=A0ABY4CLS1_9BACL|nr:hypothetical protein LSG31_21325 [Alicyclobacillaceae bacterium MYW30-H2]
MKDSYSRLLNRIYIITISFYLLTILLPNPNWFHNVISILTILCLLVSIPVASMLVKWISILFLLGGSILVFSHGGSFSSMYLLFGKMLDLLTLFTLIPCMAIPIQIGNYSPSILQLISRYSGDEQKFYHAITLIGYALASIMNLAALPMTYYSIQPALKKFYIQNEDRFLSTSITRGFAMPLVWSPVAAIVGAVVQITHAGWFWILPFSLLLSAIGIALGLLFSPRKSNSSLEASAASTSHAVETVKADPIAEAAANPVLKLGQMGLGILLFAILMTGLQQMESLSIVSAVSILALPFSFVWAVFLRKQKQFIQSGKKQLSQLANMQDQFAVFLCAGFFVDALQMSGVAPSIDQFLVHVSHRIGTAWFLMLIPLIPVFLSLVGMHPLVSIALLGESLDPRMIGIRPEWVAVAFLGGGVTTFLLSPFNATLTIMSGIMKRSPFELAKWNLPFCALYLVTVILLVSFLNLFWPHG